MKTKSLIFLLFIASSYSWTGFFDKKCQKCQERTSKQNRTYLCESHWFCYKCFIEYIDLNLLNKQLFIPCLGKDCQEKVNLNELINKHGCNGYKSVLEKLIVRQCPSCNKYIPEDESRYFSCDDHFSCKDCLSKDIEASLNNDYWAVECQFCDKIIDKDFIRDEFSELFLQIKALKKKYKCPTCHVAIDLRTTNIYYYCDAHWACEDCFITYINEQFDGKTLMIQCCIENCFHYISQDLVKTLIFNNNDESFNPRSSIRLHVKDTLGSL